jgi:TrmH family RNA methyltransferase
VVVSSRSNSAVKSIRALRQRKAREETGLFFAEGIRIVGEALGVEADVRTVVAAPRLLSSDYGQLIAQKLVDRGVICVEVTDEVFQSISSKEGPQGLGAVVGQRWETLGGTNAGSELCWIALDEVQDPGNLGSIMRTAEAVGAAGLILLGQSTDPYDPGAVRASMGSIFSQRLIRASFSEFVAWARAHDYPVIGTSDKALTDFEQATYRSPFVLLMGSEREGLAPAQQIVCDQIVSIPMVGRADSLNLAVATGLVLYESFKQNRSH